MFLQMGSITIMHKDTIHKLGEKITQMPIHSKSNYMGALEMLQSTI